MAGARVAVIGLSGRMGEEIATLLTKDTRLVLRAGVSRTAQSTSVLQVVSEISQLPANAIDVVIDFSQPDIFEAVVDWCAKNRKPLVSGVTGISEAQKGALKTASQKAAILWAPNMSIGVAVVAEMFKAFRSLTGFDFQIEEAHHSRKKDSPSGTALFLQEKLVEATGKNVPQPLAIRGGGIFGIHKTWAIAEDEMITIEHTAMNRTVFARGAIEAAVWIAKKSPGLYKMTDVLSSK